MNGEKRRTTDNMRDERFISGLSFHLLPVFLRGIIHSHLFSPRSVEFVSQPPVTLLADVFRHLPFIVVHTTTDGTVLHMNPETTRLTGYEPTEMLGKNFFAMLFPGKLFAQVPKFISLIEPSPLLKDVPMTIRTKAGKERIIAFSRYVHIGPVSVFSDSAPRTFICVGVDLTDRLTDADRDKLPPSFVTESELGELAASFGPNVGNAGAMDGEFVTPIAISPIGRGRPMIGPSPSMARMPSTIAIVFGSEALMSKIVCGMPA